MTAVPFSDLPLSDDRSWTRLLYVRVPRAAIYAYVIGLSLLYVFVYVHMPLTVYAAAPHDDGLSIKLGRYLSEWHWLGPYDQFTLMKGPGYPAFLAAANWLGLSVSLAHALFHCVAVTFFTSATHRFIRSPLISALLFLLLLWHPFLLILLRVFRDAIYGGQVLIFLAALMLALFDAPDARRRTAYSLLAGGALGWCWLTREEGVWLLPGIMVLIATAALYAHSMRRYRGLIVTLLVTAAAFVGTQAAFALGNRIVYQKFVGVDFKERNFLRTLKAIHSVRSGGTQRFVSVTRAARQRIYPFSPTFASLAFVFDVPADRGWPGLGCNSVPSTCGEIASGFFMWALRDAAEATGHYASPAKASAFFGAIADEIESACSSGALDCKPQLIAEMPPVEWAQFAQMPELFVTVLDQFLLLRPSLASQDSSGDEQVLGAALRFLNHPRHTKSMDMSAMSDRYVLSGWYLKSGGQWISPTVRDPNGTPISLDFERRPSPDLTAVDREAVAQRFILLVACSDACVLHLETPDGIRVEMRFAELRGHPPIVVPVGNGTFYIDSVEVNSREEKPTNSEKLAGRLREFVVRNYAFCFIPILSLGVAGFLVSTVLYWRNAVWNTCYVLALACWVFVFTRALMLVLISATSMYSLTGQYNGPAHDLMVAASMLSIAAAVQLFARRRPEESEGSNRAA